MNALFDTNILIDYLKQEERARELIDSQLPRVISIMTWLELLVGAGLEYEEDTRDFLHTFQVLPLTRAVAEQVVALCKRHRLKLPDAVIWATARVSSRVLVTRNTRDFPSNDPSVRFPYVV